MYATQSLQVLVETNNILKQKKDMNYHFYNELHFIVAVVIGTAVLQKATITKLEVLQSKRSTQTLGLNYKCQMLHGFAQRKLF